MAKNNNLTDFLTDVANAIREKDGSTGTINPQDFSDKIKAIQAYQGTATPTKSEQTINPTSGKYFSSFKVGAIPSEYIIPSGTLQITANGTYDVRAKENVNVNVPSGVEEVATAAAMDALLVEANVGKYYKFTGTTDSNYTNGDLYLVEGGGQ